MNLIFDTETTGLPDFKSPSDAPQQPHIVQLAMILTDAAGNEQAAVNVLIKPEGWTIPPEVTAIHGISQEKAELAGIPEALAVQLFLAFHVRCQRHVAHSLNFDRRIMRIAMLRYGMTREQCEEIDTVRGFCTMNQSREIISMAPTDAMMAAGRFSAKPPKLVEAYRFFFNEELEGAHDAMKDARGCARIFQHLQALKKAA